MKPRKAKRTKGKPGKQARGKPVKRTTSKAASRASIKGAMPRRKLSMEAILTCPDCGTKQQGIIPQGKCIPFYECKGCDDLIFSERKCCVFCEFSETECPVAHVKV